MNVGLLWIIKNNISIRFEMAVQCSKWMGRCPWYNKKICTKLNVQISEDYLKTGHKDRYELMCAVDVYDKEHVPMPDDVSSGVGRPMPITSPKEALFSLGQTINFIDNWLQCFEFNDENIITVYKRNTSELFKTIPK